MSKKFAQAQLKKLLRYDPLTGKFTWLVKRKGTRKDKHAGWQMGSYLGVVIDYKRYYLHRLAWFYMTGKWPPNEIDHINGNKLDNSWSNLRRATRAQNEMNKHTSCGKSGVKGVYLETRTKTMTYTTRIKISGKTICLGTYKTMEEAQKAYKTARVSYFGEFA